MSHNSQPITFRKKLHLVSNNLKTGYSINFPIEKTCHPSKLCREVCYAKRGRLAMNLSILRQRAVYGIFKKEDPHKVAQAIGDGYRRKGLSFLRWASSGDIFPEAANVINILARQYPDTIHWITTRRIDAVRMIEPNDNIFLSFALDKTSLDKKKPVDKLGHPRVYYAYLRQEEDEDVHGASIIYNLQQKKKELPAKGPKGSFVCPVDAERMPVKDACSKCRMCFNPRIITQKGE